MYYVYILQSAKDNRYYIGSTNDLSRRFKEHNDGQTKSTKYRRPFRLVYREVYNSKQAAHDREREIKKYKGGLQFRQLLMTG